MRTRTTILFAIATMLAGATLASAAGKPNLTGEWKIDIDKSNFGPMPPPTAYNRKVEHEDPKLKITDAQSGAMGDQTTTRSYTTDGKEVVNNIQGNDAKSTCTWEGDKLTINTKLDLGGAEVKITEKISVSEDSKVMTSVLHIVSPQGEFDITFVLNKQ